MLNSFDELYTLLSLLIERYYLSTFSGSFTEHFYGLKRERVLRIKDGELPRAQLATPNLVRETLKLRRSDIWANLAILVGIPYVKRKLDESYDIHVPSSSLLGIDYNRDRFPSNPTLKQRLFYHYKQFLRKVYPSINLAYYFSLLAFNLAYLFDNTKYTSPFLWLIGSRVRRLGSADYAAFVQQEAAAEAAALPRTRPGTSTVPPSIFSPQTLYPRALSSLKILLPASIFALKFLEWWHASDFARQLSRKATEGLELPPPLTSFSDPSDPISNPSISSTSTTTTTTTKTQQQPSHKPPPPVSKLTNLPILTVPPPKPSTAALCPICLNPINNPTACQTGFVYCYVCIFKWVDGTHERQVAFMEGGKAATRRRNATIGGGSGRGDNNDNDSDNENEDEADWADEDVDDNGSGGSREGKWENGAGRCAVSARRVLGGTDGLRRVVV